MPENTVNDLLTINCASCSNSSLVSNETETLGDMIIAAQAVGIKEIPVDFGKTMVKSGRVFYPKPENVAVYSCQFEKYKKLYQTVKPLFA